MKKIILRSIESLLSLLYGRKKYQSLFGVLYNISIRGLNLRNSNLINNGELYLIKSLTKYYEKRKEPIIIFDVGANVGNYSQFIFDEFSRKSLTFQLFSFEPLKKAYEKLEKRFQAQYEYVKTYNIGFGNTNGEVTIYANNESSELGSLYYNTDLESLNITMKSIEKVKISRLSDFCDQNNIQSIQFLKLDTEGSEIEILRSGRNLINSYKIDFIQFEFGACNVKSQTYMKIFFDLLANNYTIYRILKDGTYHYPKYHPDLEIFVIGNYLAISKGINDFIA